jgi:hypothetical protein
MRLLDLVAQSRVPFVVQPHLKGAHPVVLSGPSDFAHRIAACPHRYVLADDLTRVCAELAFADGDRLASCLDLLRIPAARLWIEWSDAIHQQVIYQCGAVAQGDPNAFGRQVGVLLEAMPGGRSGTARTFWSVPNGTGECGVELSPLESFIDLDERFEPGADANAMMRGEYGRVTDREDPGIGYLLERIRFRFDATWARYYVESARDALSREKVMRASLAAVARDIPLLLAFFLLLNAKGATRPIPIERSILNRKRRARNCAPLLDHLEVHASLQEHIAAHNEADGPGSRRPPRLHHVRGHLVRREDRVFWRTPHLRGSAAQGVVRSRTVCLSFSRAS